MRFFEHGPSIPDELLTARDEGRVVFFCGAGVSRARAGLSDFFGLADRVLQKLGVAADSPACKLLTEARELEKRTGVYGVISADRIFGLLERDFAIHDIEEAVANALQPLPGVDLSAHRILLDLAITPEGKVRLVTTNFDRLFNDCNSALRIWQPPRLPDPSRQKEMDGIIYLHGCVNTDYSGSEDEGFILSSSAFGRAYLSEGWATQFFREIIARYIVVFIGYSADDPPVHYLLEALHKSTSQLRGVYAFQAGESSEVAARWRDKGITAIAYTAEESHRALWDTLEAWAGRARAPEHWRQSVINLARKGPEGLQPYERGQVAHLISTLEGVRQFSEADPPPPAEWLCVFDPLRRYAKPGYIRTCDSQDRYVDPFDLYSLDSDIAPKKIDPEDYLATRDVPVTAWDAFAANRLDRQNLRDDSFSVLRGRGATTIPSLPSRLQQLGVWISKVAPQPPAIWWAAYQNGLHPDIQRHIHWELKYRHPEVPSVICQGWSYLFEAWTDQGKDSHWGWDALEAVIQKDGWDSAVVRRYAVLCRPYLKVKKNFWNGPKPPTILPPQLRDLLHIEVVYPNPPHDVKIPDEWLAVAIRELRGNLEHALQLETELGGDGLRNISPLVPDDAPYVDHFRRTRGLSRGVISFASLFARLLKLDIALAQQEFAAWPVHDDSIFSRLRIWACGKAEVVSAQTFVQVMGRLSNEVFWDRYHQRDLLLVLAERWNELHEETRKQIEERLRTGRARWEGEEADKFEERRAWDILSRLTWLASKGCVFSFDVEVEFNRLRQAAPTWNPQHAKRAAESMEARGGFVRTDTESSSLLHEPIASILSKAYELSGRADNFLVEKAPFAGLARTRPVRAFTALAHAARRDDYPAWAWRTFLLSDSRKNDKPKFSALIAERLSRYPDNALAEFLHPASDWILNVSEQLAAQFPKTFDKVITKLIHILRTQPPGSQTTIIRSNTTPDWTMEAINAPIGKIARALVNDPRTKGLQADGGFPTEWLAFVNDLLSLPGDLHRHALVLCAHHVSWFYGIDPKWTESHLLSILDGENENDRNAFWSGFLWAARVPDPKLYPRLKPGLLTMAKNRSLLRREYGEVLAGIILAGWGSFNKTTGERYISQGEMRDALLHADDEFRCRTLWQVERWAETNEDRTGETWATLLLTLLRDVWPRHKSIKTPTLSAQLCELVFSNTDRFRELADIIIPLVTTIDGNYFMLPTLQKSKDTIVDLYPRQTLTLLHAVLPDDVAYWPHGINEMLQRISEAESSLKADERLLELKRKWHAR